MWNLGFGNVSALVKEGPIARMSYLRQPVRCEKRFPRELSIPGLIECPGKLRQWWDGILSGRRFSRALFFIPILYSIF
jgi:hypothetical protein